MAKKKDKPKIYMVDEITGEKFDISDEDTVEINPDQMEAIKNNTADGQPIEIEANMSPELLAFLKKTDEHFIKQINKRIDTLRKIKHKYRLDSDEVETINLCIKNYKYTLDQHKKGLEKLEDNYKKTLS